MNNIEFDTGIFISPPYIKCPKCGKDSFGILMICDDRYYRRCRECFHPYSNEPEARYSLPKLNKKIIYLDQCMISNMMKIFNPQMKSFQKGTLDYFWIRCFERLDSLSKLQLIICPDSDSHTNESLLSPYFKPLKRMYEILSHGVSFYDYETIKRFQIYEHATNWISGKAEKELNLNVHSIVNGKINAWQDKLIISVNLNYDLNWIDDLRKTREKTHKGLYKIFKRWQSEKDKTFDNWVEEESMSIGRKHLEMYLNYMKKLAEISTGSVKMRVNDKFPSSSANLIYAIQKAFKRAGIQDSDIWSKTVEYLTSPTLKDIPFIKISSMLTASLARKAAAGRKKPPNQGMVNDIEVISVLLPYCDAMFIDNECQTYLKEQPLRDVINYGTKIFSQNTNNDFLNYLNEIQLKASVEHLDKVNEIYGNNWQEPYMTLYRGEKE